MFTGKFFTAAFVLAAACSASAQLFAPLDPDWKEAEVPPPPALRTSGLIEIDSPRSELRFGVDPASISVGRDRIVRYVVVVRSAGGNVTGIYEGLHCKTAEAKVYARHNGGAGWVMQADADWKPLSGAPHSSYSMQIAQQGACLGRTPNGNPGQVARDLRAPYDTKFSPQTR
ncbi:MAG: hypothetical protein HY854_23590 [Burkholderiales bacterium]|nr:hypothetical protein [Burkholderiales bacterium]